MLRMRFRLEVCIARTLIIMHFSGIVAGNQANKDEQQRHPLMANADLHSTRPARFE